MKAGDVVYLKSGGPLMTVVNVIDESVHCTWFNDKKVLEAASFHIVTLENDDESNATDAYQL
ncbi:YodC family protein [Shewanella oncorhynchi]|uniref:YodC family protein n=1 Tax=Shewanella oncorhynchi TaxID=2726434 RepID=UPI002E7B2234|nr:DUF2158 domain-containing protein [Shewanella oncorhynchi]WVI95376.1 DUF2158 domain-containing protein [Shewanella oncorhynchi]WVI95382.1 DUF2158 domain-containing protein [Shewanella oncorhynchi]